MSGLEKIGMADIKKAIGEKWIANVEEDKIMENPMLARLVKDEENQQEGIQVPRERTKRGKGKDKPIITLLVRCPKCRHTQYEYAYSLSDQPWFKCEGCGQLTPSGVWDIISVTTDKE